MTTGRKIIKYLEFTWLFFNLRGRHCRRHGDSPTQATNLLLTGLQSRSNSVYAPGPPPWPDALISSSRLNRSTARAQHHAASPAFNSGTRNYRADRHRSWCVLLHSPCTKSKRTHQSPPKRQQPDFGPLARFRAPQGRNPSAGLAPQAPFRNFWAPVTCACAIVLGIVLESYGVFALGGPSRFAPRVAPWPP